jgi:SAM-dependent methyltransferase
MEEARLKSPSVARNREPILEALRAVLPPQGVVLEIASGSGEHAAFFAENLPNLVFYPSDPDASARRSIESWRLSLGLANLRAALALDAREDDWPVDAVDAILCINMIHISPWSATEGLFKGAARILARNAPLYLYGPYKRQGVETAPSNIEFEAWLKTKDPAFGLRDLEAVAECALRNGFLEPAVIEMPANNLSVIFRRA